MWYSYREDIALADAAFVAGGATVEEMFLAAADATVNVMVTDLDTIGREDEVSIVVTAESREMLLYAFLSELLFLKDVRTILPRLREVVVTQSGTTFTARARGYGERVKPGKHPLGVDVKAVTLHAFRVEERAGGWEAQVVLDL